MASWKVSTSGVLFFGKQVDLVRHEEVWVSMCTDVFEPFFCCRKVACEVAS